VSDAQRTPDDPVIRIRRDALAVMFGYVDETILCCDSTGVIRFATDSLRDLLGYDPGSVVGENVLDFVHADHLVDLFTGMTRWEGRRGNIRGETIQVRDSGGEWRRVHYDVVVEADLEPLGSIVVTLAEPGAVDEAARELRSRSLTEHRMLRLASAFLEVPYADFEQGLDSALGILAGLSWVTRASVWTVDDLDRGYLTRRATWTAPANAPTVDLPGRIGTDALMLTRRLAAGEEVHLAHRDDGPRPGWETEHAVLASAGTESLLAVPMTAHGHFSGAVVIESALEGASYDATHTSTVRAAAAIIAQALVRHEAERRLIEQARSDRVTGLSNRWAFDEALDRALARLQRGDSLGVGLGLVDLDRFKVVNDSLGHAVGDHLLADVASRLRSAADDSMVIARLGGDELLVLLDDSPDRSDAHWRLATLLDALRVPFTPGGAGPLVMTASAGLVHTHDGHTTAGELLRRADVAMYAAKGRGGDAIALDDPATDVDDVLHLRREVDLREALGSDGLEVHFQGEWDLTTDRLVGAEALARWNHPTEGLLAAGEFIPLAEATGLIDRLGHRVLRDACRAARPWLGTRNGPEVLRVNVASSQLRRPDFVHQVVDALADAGLPPRHLCLELTESTLLVDPAAAATRFEQLREIGVGLAIDDFGTGYSSILQLKRLPLTAVKVDRSFVSGLARASSDRAIVAATVSMARGLGLDVTAEGVETETQREILLELGCTRAQGFLLSRPEPAAAIASRVVT